jgi:argininosuccinate lyase
MSNDPNTVQPPAERFPAPVYAETILTVNFDESKKHFLDSLIEIHFAHTLMLLRQGILSREEAAQAFAALRRLDRNQLSRAVYDGTCEDLFFHIEELMGEAGQRIHVARSRNDIAITLFRMRLRGGLLKLIQALLEVRERMLRLAAEHVETVMPAHTHTQPAQPTTLAHYLLAGIECFGRDALRLQAAFADVNRSPMGACAITTTGFPIDREYTASLLGFEGLAENSYGAIAAIDYSTASAAAVAVSMVNLGKITQDLLLWSTREFGYVRLGAGYVQSSSIMPQKRNPVALEHTRILASRALGEAQAVLTCAHNTPFGDINDSEDDLQPLIFTMFDDAGRALRLLAGTLGSLQVDRHALRQRAAVDFLTVTELADTLVRHGAVSFREAHDRVVNAVAACGDRFDRVAEVLLSQNPELGIPLAQLQLALDPDHFVQIRGIAGGPAPDAVRLQIDAALRAQTEFTRWLECKESLQTDYRAQLQSSSVL